MGFIAPADGSADVFVHRSALVDGNALMVGSSVIFESGWDDAKSKPIATKCGGAVGATNGSVPGSPTPLPNGQPGTVKAWIENRGMGFITPADGSQDVFVHRSNLVDGNSLVTGAKVIFEAGWDEQKDKPIAKAVNGASTNLGGPQSGHPMVPNGQPGTVKAWIETRGMGFITPADGRDDVFVHRSNLVDGDSLVVGAQVIFELGFDAQKGKPIAKACAGAVPGQGGPPPGMAYGGGGIQTCGGTIKVWFADKGYGFITLDNGMGDAFAGSGAMPPGMIPTDGLRITCSVQWNNEKQKYTAVEIFDASKGKGKGGAPGDTSDNCFVSGLPLDINETKLQEIFGAYGNVVSCKVLPGEGRPDRAALVRFGSADEAKWIVERVSGETLGLPGPISVKFAASKMTPGQAGPGGKGYGGKGFDGKGFDGKGYGGKGYGGKGGGCGPGYGGCPGNQFSLPPGRGVQAARLGTVRAVLGSSLLVSPSEGGLDVSVPRELLLDGDPQIGGLVSFSASTGTDYGRAPQGGMNNRFSPYGAGGGNFNPQRATAGGQQSGVVKAWMENRGMGFIAPSDGSADLFVHRSYLQDGGSLALGSQVTFTAEFDPQKGKPIAKNVMGAIPQPPQ